VTLSNGKLMVKSNYFVMVFQGKSVLNAVFQVVGTPTACLQIQNCLIFLLIFKLSGVDSHRKCFRTVQFWGLHTQFLEKKLADTRVLTLIQVP
jgi:hypothetical protein